MPAYLSAKQYEEAGYSRKDLLPFIHRVNHVGGGALGIYVMAADLLITINGHLLRLDAVVGEMQVATSSMLIGATTMSREDVNAVLFMRDAYAQMRGDNGDTFNVGTKAPNAGQAEAERARPGGPAPPTSPSTNPRARRAHIRQRGSSGRGKATALPTPQLQASTSVMM